MGPIVKWPPCYISDMSDMSEVSAMMSDVSKISDMALSHGTF